MAQIAEPLAAELTSAISLPLAALADGVLTHPLTSDDVIDGDLTAA